MKAEYLNRLEPVLASHMSLSRGQDFDGPLFTQDQLAGRVAYVGAINPDRRRVLRQRLSAIDWDALTQHATDRGLVVCRRSLLPIARPTVTA